MGEALITRRGSAGGGSKELKLLASGSISGTRTTITLPKPLSAYNRLVFSMSFSYTTKSSLSSTNWTSCGLGFFKGNVTPDNPYVTDNRMIIASLNMLYYGSYQTQTSTLAPHAEALVVPYRDTVFELVDSTGGVSPNFGPVTAGTVFADEKVITFVRSYGASGTLTSYGTYTIHHTTVDIYGTEA